ncbi:SDR family NAD(P)-dependent oxidoreductase [Providencia sp. PROV255]|uniref:SDR family NAD(P)-dependent oxidoreductase n=1 Tax=Providencia sp. PROV255 TaxID=2949943 RepID=UPI00234ACAB7|nr:SDR family oxidoreductase [Providencia sp. PROV255]
MVMHNVENELSGKVALVTGGSRGIGREIALTLAKMGVAYVGIHCGKDQVAAQSVIREIHQLGVEADIFTADFSHNAGQEAILLWEKFFGRIQEKGYQGIDILVNCAGIAPSGSITETEPDIYAAVMSINVEAPVFLLKAAIPHINAAGRIINVSTVLTRVADPQRAIYAASKGAINTLTLSLASELGARGITVNAVAPGVVDTDMNSAWLHEAQAQKMASEFSVFSRVGRPNDIADVVSFLASERSRWITGQVIDTSGGSCL